MISDSASGRSNGVRFTSAMLAIVSRPNPSRPGGENTNQPYSSCLSKIVTRLRLPAQSTTGTVARTWGISYETSCATARIAPSQEYAERRHARHRDQVEQAGGEVHRRQADAERDDRQHQEGRDEQQDGREQ